MPDLSPEYGLCVTKLGIELPALVDEPDNRVERAYTAWPDRLYVIELSDDAANRSSRSGARFVGATSSGPSVILADSR